jgi:nicotinate-nucleotide pyrophosphorylase (carboxylating)
MSEWLREDVPDFDVGSVLFAGSGVTGSASLWCKSPSVVAGLAFCQEAVKLYGVSCAVEEGMGDGVDLRHASPESKVLVATLSGEVATLLRLERILLNVLSRASGIATATRAAVETVARESPEWKGRVAGTRKTTPGFRLIEKSAIVAGGADPHRMNLSSAVMLKDNHRAAASSLPALIAETRRLAGFTTKIEVEVDSLAIAKEAAAAGADIIMFDNYADPADLQRDAASLKEAYPHIIAEASGGLTPSTLGAYAVPAIDILSTSSIHQGVPHCDFSLKLN